MDDRRNISKIPDKSDDYEWRQLHRDCDRLREGPVIREACHEGLDVLRYPESRRDGSDVIIVSERDRGRSPMDSVLSNCIDEETDRVKRSCEDLKVGDLLDKYYSGRKYRDDE